MTIAATMPADSRTPAADRAGDGAAREVRARCAIASSNQVPRCTDVDERAALHRADQRRPPPRQRALVIRHAGIQVARGASKLNRKAHAPAGAPLAHLRRAPASRRR